MIYLAGKPALGLPDGRQGRGVSLYEGLCSFKLMAV